MSNAIKIVLVFLFAALIAFIVRIVVAGVLHPSAAAPVIEKVRVSAVDLPQGLLLRDEDLAWKPVPAIGIPAGAIIDGAPNTVLLKGALLRRAVAKGTVIVADDVILPNAPGFLAATLKPEMRAVSVAVDEVSGNAGLIQPGDYVDLLLTQLMDRRTNSPELAVSSETVVERVRVLAVGTEIQRPESGDAPDVNNRIRTVTLEVTPHTGEVITVAARLGSLSLALRSFATATRDSTASAPANSLPPPVWAGDISRALRELPGSGGAQLTQAAGGSPASTIPPAVTIYRGSDRSDAQSSVAQSGNSVSGNNLPPVPSLPAQR
ncbi:Flp pilus assembly protein CpaB [Paraburkholderia sp. SARCC-3016]|uniref:Flp pilus assembly protein CpaB n=1 Tax=Paraburkholderia sp. SARCC-3016 TaxID=3058611 RepID=UPI002806F31C|nr:Flp pilus assembly protein CpaB [Paraburkholderia sp. SARCC-3016]MDQ7981726.1 Flp pilus assembly protein CpaB [Paraburkholderia sp. SARCC-3016]